MSNDSNSIPEDPNEVAAANTPAKTVETKPTIKEIGGPKEADPTRYGDWTVKGRCIDF